MGEELWLILKGIGFLYLIGVTIMAIVILSMVIALVVDYIRFDGRKVNIKDKE